MRLLRGPAPYFAIAISVACIASTFFPNVAMNLPLSLTFLHDAFGRNLFSLTLQAGARSGAVSLMVSVITLMIGSALGMLLALSPLAKNIGNRILDFWLCFPSILIALCLSVWIKALGINPWISLWISLILGALPTVIRMVSLKSEQILTQEYILASKSLGATRFKIAHTHLLPATLEMLAIKAPSLFAGTLLAETSLSFLGLGAPLGEVTLGYLLLQGKEYLIEAPHIALLPGALLFLYSISLLSLSEDLSTSWNRRYS